MTCLDDNYGAWIKCDCCGREMDFRCKPECPWKVYHAKRDQGLSHLEAGGFDPKGCPDCTCGTDERYSYELQDVQHDLWTSYFQDPDGLLGYRPLFVRGLPADFPDHLCRACALKFSPYVQRFTDIWLLDFYANKLKRICNEIGKSSRRTANHRASANDAGKRRQGRDAGRSGYR